MNWQNIPRDDKTVKRAVIPKRGSFSFFDFKQIEPRLLGYFAAKMGDPRLANKVREGFDPYTVIVRGIYGDNVTDEQRQKGKVLFLSLMYGGGVGTIQRQFGVGRDEARAMIDDFHKAWPMVRMLQRSVQETHARRGYIRTPWGRHLHMEEFGEHKLLNKLIQGSAADLMKASLIRMDKWIRSDSDLQSRMVSVIHDEVIFDGPPEEIDWLHENVPPLMREDWLTDVIPIDVDHEVSFTSWAEKLGYEDWVASQREVAA